MVRDKATFEILRVGADFEKWKQSVGEFLAQAKRQRGQTLSTGMNIVASKQNSAKWETCFDWPLSWVLAMST